MIEIIQNNFVPPFPKTVRCDNCNSILLLNDRGDCVYPKTKNSSPTMICPCCHTTSTFKEVEVNIDSKVKNGSEEIEIVDDVEKGFSTLK